MIYNSISVSKGGMPLYVHPTPICIGESQKEKKREERDQRIGGVGLGEGGAV